MDEVFTGKPGPNPEVLVGAGFMNLGESYLIDGGQAADGTVWPAICGQSGTITEQKMQIRYLKDAARGKKRTPSTSIRLFEDFTAMRGIEIALRGPGGVHKARTDANGWAHYARLKPGSYSLVQLPAHHMMDPNEQVPTTFTVYPGSCSTQTWYFRGDGIVSGRVLTEDGLPLSGVTLELVGSGESKPHYKTVSTAEGGFQFKAVTSGTFHLGTSVVDLSNVPRSLLGGGHPTDLAVEPGGTVDNLELRIPDPGGPRSLVFHLTDGEGQPIKGAYLQDMKLPLNPNAAGLASNMYSDENGDLTVEARSKVSYRVKARFSDFPISRWKESDPVTITPEMDPLRYDLRLKPIFPLR